MRRLKWPDRSVPVRNRVWYDSTQGLVPCVLLAYHTRDWIGRPLSLCRLRPLGAPRSRHGGLGHTCTRDFWANVGDVWLPGAKMNDLGTRCEGKGWTPQHLEV